MSTALQNFSIRHCGIYCFDCTDNVVSERAKRCVGVFRWRSQNSSSQRRPTDSDDVCVSVPCDLCRPSGHRLVRQSGAVPALERPQTAEAAVVVTRAPTEAISRTSDSNTPPLRGSHLRGVHSSTFW